MPSSKGSSRLVKYTSEKALEDEESSSEIFLTDVASALRCKMSDGSDGDGITLQMMDRSIKQFLCDSGKFVLFTYNLIYVWDKYVLMV